MLHIGIIWASPHSNNLGVSALGYSSLALLNDICKENNIEADFTVVGNGGKIRDKIYINKYEIPFYNVAGNDQSEWKSLGKLVFFPKRYCTKQLLKLDIVFDISGGDSFSDIYGENRYKRVMNSKRFFNFLKTPQILLPQTIGPFRSKINEKHAFRIMRKMDMVISRDKQSKDYTSQFLPKDKIMEAIDVAFYMPFEKLNLDPEKVHVGINISGLLWNGGYKRKNDFNLSVNYRQLMENAVHYFAGIENVVMHFISHVNTRRATVEDDYTVVEEFYKRHPGSVLAPIFESPIEAKSYISGLDFFFGARMHACIAAFSSGVPVFPMAYSRKFNGLFIETLQYNWLGDCINENEEVILNNLIRAFNTRDEIKKDIQFINNNIVADRLNDLKAQLSRSIKNIQINL